MNDVSCCTTLAFQIQVDKVATQWVHVSLHIANCIRPGSHLPWIGMTLGFATCFVSRPCLSEAAASLSALYAGEESANLALYL